MKYCNLNILLLISLIMNMLQKVGQKRFKTVLEIGAGDGKIYLL